MSRRERDLRFSSRSSEDLRMHLRLFFGRLTLILLLLLLAACRDQDPEQATPAPELEAPVEATVVEAEAEVVKVWYLVGQLNSQGPIIETWVDAAGEIVLQKAEGIELVRSSREEIKERWPKELASVLPDKKKMKAK